jgi:hypothetical protein
MQTNAESFAKKGMFWNVPLIEHDAEILRAVDGPFGRDVERHVKLEGVTCPPAKRVAVTLAEPRRVIDKSDHVDVETRRRVERRVHALSLRRQYGRCEPVNSVADIVADSLVGKKWTAEDWFQLRLHKARRALVPLDCPVKAYEALCLKVAVEDLFCGFGPQRAS